MEFDDTIIASHYRMIKLTKDNLLNKVKSLNMCSLSRLCCSQLRTKLFDIILQFHHSPSSLQCVDTLIQLYYTFTRDLDIIKDPNNNTAWKILNFT